MTTHDLLKLIDSLIWPVTLIVLVLIIHNAIIEDIHNRK